MEVDLQQYEIIERIVKNQHYDVFKIQHKESKDFFMAKISNKKVENNSRNIIYQGATKVNEYNSPSIIKCIGYSSQNFEGNNFPVSVLEYCPNGTLNQIIESGKSASGLNDTQKLIILYGISNAISIIHSKNMVFEDLVASNVFLDESYYPKLHGFSFVSPATDISAYEDKDEVEGPGVETDEQKPAAYFVPEIIDRKFPFHFKSDVFSFGLVAYELLHGHSVFTKKFNLVKLLIGAMPEFDDSVPKCYQDLIKKCISSKISERPTFSEILTILKTDENFHKNVNMSEFESYLKLLELQIAEAKSLLADDKKRAFELFRDLAKSGNAEASNYCGLLLVEGSSEVPFDADEAAKYFKVSADCGFLDGINNYGCFLLQTDIANGDFADQYLKAAADKGSSDAMVNYGRLLYYGDALHGVSQSKAEAMKYFRMAADANNADGLFFYGLMLKRGECGAQPDIKRAFQMFKESASLNGNPEAMREMALLLADDAVDIGAEHNADEAEKLLKKAAEKGDSHALHQLARLRLLHDREGAQKTYMKAAELGLPDATNEYALLIADESDIANSEKQQTCTVLFKSAASLGSVDAIYNYGWSLFNALGTDRDLEKARECFRVAAEAGNVDAMYKYADMSAFGLGGNKDLGAAAEFFKRAADSGSSDAMFRYASLALRGSGTDQSDDEALKYFKMAAELEHPAACNSVGEMMLSGKGVQKNKEKAIEYFKMAADLEDPEGLKNYKNVSH